MAFLGLESQILVGGPVRLHRLLSLGIKAMTNKSLSLPPGKTGFDGPVHSPTEPKDCLGVCVICFICIVGVALVYWIQIAYSPSVWAHLVIALPPVLLACLLPILLLKGCLTRSRSCMKATAERIEIPQNASGVYIRAAA